MMVADAACYRYPGCDALLDAPGNLRYPEMARVVDGLAEAIVALACTAGATGAR